MPQKFDGQIMLRLDAQVAEELRQTAREQRPRVEAADLLRRAASAIVACHKLYGEVPMDMELRQRLVAAQAEELPPRSELAKKEPRRKAG